MDRLRTQVTRACQELIPSGARVLVAVSGGADSLALLHLLAEQAPQRAWALTMAHFNHRQDPEIDDVAVSTLTALAETLAVPFISAEAGLPPGSAEADLRQARYRFLYAAAVQSGSSHVAVGHHADDQAETLLWRLLRGAVGGLGGMRQDRALNVENSAIRLVRPLLHVHRQDLRIYGEAMGLRPIDDPSNGNLRFKRNVLRQRVLPELETLWPGSGATLARTAQWLQEDDDWLQAEADVVLSTLPPPPADLPIAHLADLPGPIRRRALRTALTARGVPFLDSQAMLALEAILAGTRPGTSLAGNWHVRRHGGHLSISQETPPSPNDAAVPLMLQAGEHGLPGWPYRVTVRPAMAQDQEDAWQIRLPLALVSGAACWRRAMAGDRLATTAGRLKLGEMLRTRGLSPAQRRRQLVLADDDGVIWAVGVRRSNRWVASTAGEPAWLVHITETGRPDD